MNITKENIDDLNYTITMTGGIFGRDIVEKNGTVDILAGDTAEIKAVGFGLGPIDITLNVAGIEASATGMLIVILVVGVSS